MKAQLKAGLASLPAPSNDFEIVLPEVRSSGVVHISIPVAWGWRRKKFESKRALAIIYLGIEYRNALDKAGIQTIENYNESINVLSLSHLL